MTIFEHVRVWHLICYDDHMHLARLVPFRKKTPHVVVDIGSSSVKLATVTHGSGSRSISQAATVPLPPGSIQNGWIEDRTAVIEAIKEYTQGRDLRASAAIAAVPGRAVMIKTLELPIMEIVDLETTIEFQAMEMIPENLDNVFLDYQVIGQTKENTQLRVLLTAAKKGLVRSYMEVLAEAGLAPMIIDVDYFALQNLCHRLHAIADNELVCVVHIGASVTTVLMLSNELRLFSTDLETAGKLFTERVADGLGLSFEEAEKVKLDNPNRCATQDTTRLLFSLCNDLANAVKREIGLFAGMNEHQAIDCIYLCGGGAKLPGLRETLAEHCHRQVKRCEPLLDTAVASANDSTDGLPPEFAVLGGLAMR